jgi:hypothetical protein
MVPGKLSGVSAERSEARIREVAAPERPSEARPHARNVFPWFKSPRARFLDTVRNPQDSIVFESLERGILYIEFVMVHHGVTSLGTRPAFQQVPRRL